MPYKRPCARNSQAYSIDVQGFAPILTLMDKPAIILTSGGLDSTTLLAIARAEGWSLHCLTLDYGQSHRQELPAAQKVAKYFGAAQHKILKVELSLLGGSSLTGEASADHPHNRSVEEIATGGIPSTYVPARNTVFLSMALAWAEAIGSQDIFIGVNAIDYSGYPDCRPEFIKAFENLANLATREGVEHRAQYQVHTPLLRLTKAQIILKGAELGVDYGLTHSCYFPAANGRPCGECDSCVLRAKGFAEANLPDPLLG